MTWALLVTLYVAAGLAAGWDARRKGYDDLPFTLIAVVLGPLALIGMWFLPVKALKIGTTVRPAAAIKLDNGDKIPPSHVTVVRAVDVKEGEIVCLVTSRSGSKHWVAQEALTRVNPIGVRTEPRRS